MATKDREEKSWFEKFAENETCRKWVVIAGVAGIALIFLSGLFSPGKEETQEASSQPAAQSAQAYTQELEQSLAELVTNIQGAGNAKVMVTVERSAEQVYAQEEKRSTQTTEDRGSNNSTETNYILVKDADGSQRALAVTEVQPVVKGVVVVCDGGDDPVGQQRVIDAVTTALDITSVRVCVVKAADTG